MSIELDGFNPVQNIAAILLNNGLVNAEPTAVLVALAVVFTVMITVVSVLATTLPLIFKGNDND